VALDRDSFCEQTVFDRSNACFTAGAWFDKLTMTFVILSLSKDAKSGYQKRA
jgi:hypothetical protein